MRHIVKAAVLVVVLALLAPYVVFADYVSDAAQALQQRSVYVAPDTEGTDNDTAGRLQTRLKKNDNIVLVMLPAAAETELGADISAIATRLSEELENKRIIGLAVGNEVVGYAPTLPAGVAADQMRRARSVSNDPITALSTFAQNMHIWESENPLPSPTPKPQPPDSAEEGGSTWLWWLVIPIIAAFFVTSIASLVIRSMSTPANKERTHFKAPDQVKDLLERIARQRLRVEDPELKKALNQLCVDIEHYFKKYSKTKDRDALAFKTRLTEVAEVLEKYVEIQQESYYFNSPKAKMDEGKSSIIDFQQYVIELIRSGNAADLIDYTVSTQILQAQRHRR